MAHACCTRLSLKKGRAENRIIQVVDVSPAELISRCSTYLSAQSPSLPPNEASFAITEGGVTDATGTDQNHFYLRPSNSRYQSEHLESKQTP